MRTTVEFSLPLMRAAKARAAEQGESLKSLLSRAVEAELGRQRAAAPPGHHVVLPLFGNPAGPLIRLSNADLERILAEEDARAGVPVRGRGKRLRRR